MHVSTQWATSHMRLINEIQFIALLMVLSLAGGLLTGEMGWSCFVASMIWIVRQYAELDKFGRWAKRPLKLPPNMTELWYDLANTPYRQLGRERQRTRNMLARVREVVGVTELIPDAVIVLDEAGSIEAMNSAARSLFRLEKSDIGLGLASIVRSPDFAAFIRRGNTEGAPLEFSSPLNPDQQLEARSFDSESQRKLILVRDITSSNRLLTMRQQFVANVSHELRTPLAVVNGYLETINDETISDELKLTLVGKFTSPMNRMQALVEDLMLLTQLESSTAISEPRVVTVTQIIKGAVDEIQSLQRHPNQLVLRCESTRKILGIEKELHSVCVNLLSNAIRYSAPDGVIEISWTDHGDKVRLSVSDQGAGIPAEYIDRLTERFFRVDVSGSQARGGTGLGLAIVKHVLKRHDSELHVRSILNEGSNFYCEFDPAPQDLTPTTVVQS